MAKYLKRHEGIEVSHVFVADLWREHRLKPHKLSRDPHFAEKVADIVGLYLAPPAAAVVLCRREVRGAGIGPYSVAASHDIRQNRETDSRLRQAWHNQPVRPRWTLRLEKSLVDAILDAVRRSFFRS
jgi:hypothetical protein